MRLAIMSDIHGNLEAFKEVLADIEAVEVDGVACLGDNVGYGPEPEAVVQLLREQNIPSVMGNHELSIVDPEYFSWMNPPAQQSLIITEELLSENTIRYLKTLPPSMPFHGSLCVHGCPPESITTYLFELSRSEFKETFLAMPEKVCFVGHTHDLELFSFDGQKVKDAPLEKGIVTLKKGEQYIVNIGSVGQPRDGNNNAKYVIWDDESGSLEVRFVPYDIAKTADKILELGLPEYNASRLW
jgi:predicted phosphodiesterase